MPARTRAPDPARSLVSLTLKQNNSVSQLPELRNISVGLANFFLLHSSAALTINENCDPSVRRDLERELARVWPDGTHYEHSDEG